MPLNDTFPPRNLPDGATEWGRTLETEVRLSQSDLVQLQQSVSGQNRTTAASLGELARQIDTLANQQEELTAQQAALAALVDAIPVTRVNQSVDTGWTPSTSWATVSTVDIAFPTGKTSVSAQAVAAVNIDFSNAAGLLTGRARVVIDGNVGVTMGVRGMMTGSTTIGGSISGTAQNVLTRSGGGTVSASVQVEVQWVSGGPGSVSWSASAQVALSATFTP